MTEQRILSLYRERDGNPEFWAEPLNALTNASFLIAAAFALHLAVGRRATTPMTFVLISLAAVIGLGSFLFHTVATPLTRWLDIIPIALFQILFLWLLCREMLGLRWTSTVAVMAAVIGLAFVLLPIQQPLNGSLFYAPLLVAMLSFGLWWSERSPSEPYLLVGATCFFAVAITARTIDWTVPWPLGTHFLWHLLNGAVVYLALRTWVVFIASKQNLAMEHNRSPAEQAPTQAAQ